MSPSIAFFSRLLPSALSCESRFRLRALPFDTDAGLAAPLLSSSVSARFRRIAAKLAANAFAIVGSALSCDVGLRTSLALLFRRCEAAPLATELTVDSNESRRILDPDRVGGRLPPPMIAARLLWTSNLSPSTLDKRLRSCDVDDRGAGASPDMVSKDELRKLLLDLDGRESPLNATSSKLARAESGGGNGGGGGTNCEEVDAVERRRMD